MKVILCRSVTLEDLAVDISLVEVVPLLLVPDLFSGVCRNEATSAIRNSQLNPQ